MSSSQALRQVFLQPNKRASHLGRHPWILASSIVEPASKCELGEQVDLIQGDGKWVGRGLYNPHSRIRLRMYTWDPNEWIDGDWIALRIDRAIALRRILERQSQYDAMRIVFSEADQLSGLVVDRFGEHLVIQLTAGVLAPFMDRIIERLSHHLEPASISIQTDGKTAQNEGIEVRDEAVLGTLPAEPITIQENGLLWRIDLQAGQKTGYYLDQRDNRMAAARWAPENGRILDVCTYAGGFALTIAKHAAGAQITAIDSSAKALELARENAVRNGLQEKIEWEQADFLDAMSARVDRGDLYDMIVLDPPRLAGSREHVQRALHAYHRLNYLATRTLRPGGILVTCSCSGRVTREDFREMLQGVAVRARREMQILENRGPSADHPVAIHCPETDYLKCFIARVL